MTRAAATREDAPPLPAGEFSSWLRDVRRSLQSKTGSAVACGDCIGCCSSAYFIHVRPEDRAALAAIPPHALVKAPGLPHGHRLMGYDEHGRCPMLRDGGCSIYADRPQTCRDYDCRVFAAAGIAAGGSDKAVINRRVKQWVFTYPGATDRREHAAVRGAARFIQNKATAFPGGRAPTNPSQVAILAIKAYRVFIDRDPVELEAEEHACDAALAIAVIDACRAFDDPGGHPTTGMAPR